MIIINQQYCLKDLAIVPAVISNINSRSECNPFDKNNKYPLFCAPMSCVTDEKNYFTWESKGIYPILPRTVKYNDRIKFINMGKWVALSQKEFKELFVDNFYKYDNINKYYICIDTANAHRKSLYDEINKAKRNALENNYELVVMVGNIANPETYEWICKNSNVDYVRISIGTGKGCITTTQSAVHYPEASLLKSCVFYKNLFKNSAPKIICDGGIRNYSDIIVALALGADYCMIGSLFASMDESCAKIDELSYKKIYYGMSTKKAQILINNALKNPVKDFVPKTSEGTEKLLDSFGSVSTWLKNFDSYLRSAMSYTDCFTLDEFISGKVTLIVKSPETNNSINK